MDTSEQPADRLTGQEEREEESLLLLKEVSTALQVRSDQQQNQCGRLSAKLSHLYRRSDEVMEKARRLTQVASRGFPDWR